MSLAICNSKKRVTPILTIQLAILSENIHVSYLKLNYNRKMFFHNIALCIAGSISFEDTLRILRVRG